MARPHIVIVGAGFGGMYTARNLERHVARGLIDVTVINRTNYFLFTPLLHEVATGGLAARNVTEPLREIFHTSGIRVYQGDVTAINTDRKAVMVGGTEISYDYLVVSTGAETNYYNIPGAAEYTLPIKTLPDAVRLRERIIDTFEWALLANNATDKQTMLSFVVVGGGPTGVETVAELQEFAHEITERYYGKTKCISPEDLKITLVSTDKEILKQFNLAIRHAATKRLESKGIILKLGTAVTGVSPQMIQFADGTSLSANIIVWAAGVKAVVPPFEPAPTLIAGGRLPADEFLRLAQSDSVFVLGDSGTTAVSDTKPPIPMLAQVAVKQADLVAYNIMASITGKKLESFSLHLSGSLVSLGQWFAAGDLASITIYGRFAWWVWRTVYLSKFLSWKKRIRIAFDWTFDLFYPRDITKLL